MNNQLVSGKAIGLTRYHLSMDEDKTTYEAMFLEDDHNKLTPVVQYGETVGIAFQVYCANGFYPNQYEYQFRLFENKKGKDSEAQFSDPSMTEFDKSYRSCSVTFNTLN